MKTLNAGQLFFSWSDFQQRELLVAAREKYEYIGDARWPERLRGSTFLTPISIRLRLREQDDSLSGHFVALGLNACNDFAEKGLCYSHFYR